MFHQNNFPSLLQYLLSEDGTTCHSHDITAIANHNHIINYQQTKSSLTLHFLVQEVTSLAYTSQQRRKDSVPCRLHFPKGFVYVYSMALSTLIVSVLL